MSNKINYSIFKDNSIEYDILQKYINLIKSRKLSLNTIIKNAMLNETRSIKIMNEEGLVGPIFASQNVDLLNALLANGININGDDNIYTKSYIYEALKNGDYNVAYYLVLKGAKFNYDFKFFDHSLLYDVLTIKDNDDTIQINSQIRLLKLLICRGVKLVYNKDNKHRLTPYLYAIHQGFPKEITDLIFKYYTLQGGYDYYYHPYTYNRIERSWKDYF